ncbi:MAG: hypothetical protein ACI9FJ_003357 [Alteromonadaceae bacterium]|jgi:uncharacterized protein YqcC (DUF446 family)
MMDKPLNKCKNKYNSTVLLLSDIQTQLELLGLWQSHRPTARALASELPFCCDTLDFHQWLQFILIPRMTALIDGRLPLPDKIAIAPMAEEAFKVTGASALSLIQTIRHFDRLLSGSVVTLVALS